MAREHSFSIGLPDNIVYCSEFLDTLQDKLDRYANRCFLFTALSFALFLAPFHFAPLASVCSVCTARKRFEIKPR